MKFKITKCHKLNASIQIPAEAASTGRPPQRSHFLHLKTRFIHSLINIQPLGRFQQEPEPSQATDMALAHGILGKFLGVVCHCFPPPLDVPTFSVRCPHVQRHERPLAAEGGNLRGRQIFRQISSRIRLPRNSRYLLRAANLRHGTDGFTPPPEGRRAEDFFRP